MNASRILLHSTAAALFLAAAAANAATLSGTVTNKTTGKPSAGDTVVLVDVQAGMGEVAKATTNAQGRYSLTEPGSGPYLIRALHQGVGYFIAAPQGGGAGDISVYDVAEKVDGVSIEADVFEFETDAAGQLHVNERYFVHNTSNPPRTAWNQKSFMLYLPPEATVGGVAAQRPAGLPTNLKLDPAGAKGEYAFNFPIEPDQGDKDTLFQIEYTVPYSGGKFTFHPRVSLPAQTIGVLLPKSMTFAGGSSSGFTQIQQDPGVQTWVVRNVAPGKGIEFTISGTGSMPRENQGNQGNDAAGAPNGGQPGGGIGQPINTPDPLSKYKWWILGGLALLLAAAAAFLLRKPAGAPATAAAPARPVTAPTPGFNAATYTPAPAAPAAAAPAGSRASLLAALKDELFALESEKLSGAISAEEYAEVKPALEVVLKHALKRNA